MQEATARYQFHEALRHLWEDIALLNQQRARPWEALRAGRVHQDLADWIRQIGAGLRPFLPRTADEVERRFSCLTIEVGEILFPRL